jgi:hypothetical protein
MKKIFFLIFVIFYWILINNLRKSEQLKTTEFELKKIK